MSLRVICTRCRTPKPAAEFSPNPRTPSGLASQCKACRASAAREARAKAKAPRPVVRIDGEPGPMAAALEVTLAAMTPPPSDTDAAVVALLRHYAEHLDARRDDPAMVARLGSGFLTTLRACRLTVDTTATANAPARPVLNASDY